MTINEGQLECDLKVSCPRFGRGGQHVGSPPPTVIVEHIPTGLKVEVTARSQHRSRAIAIEMIEYGLTFIKDF